jgi:hypothetical protein
MNVRTGNLKKWTLPIGAFVNHGASREIVLLWTLKLRAVSRIGSPLART